jgi:hypothetical protein
MRAPTLALAASLLLIDCATPRPGAPADLAATPETENPPAPGFDRAGSDPRAIAIADATMRAMGGRRAWDATRTLCWRFFGARLHLWDRHTGDVRIEYDDRKRGERVLILMNLTSGAGRAFRAGQEVTAPDELAALLKRGREAWINDSYWLVMPYKLKDSGVTLRYQGEAPMQDGRQADVLTLTFAGVGVTPENKYDVYVARDTGLVEQWSFYPKAEDTQPDFTTPWRNWRRHGGILLSDDRGEGKRHTDVAVLGALPDAVWRSPAPLDLAALLATQGPPIR